MKKILVITDNELIYTIFLKVVQDKGLLENFNFDYAFSSNKKRVGNISKSYDLKISNHIKFILENYNLVLSLHCKQIFPSILINNIKCINIHPGFNPYNRGYFPHIFSIINKLPSGVTIHEMNENIDCGNIIAQEQIIIESFDTSESVYNKIVLLEKKLIEQNIVPILENSYKPIACQNDGNMNYRKDFDNLCKINLDEITTYREVIDKFRALTHKNHSNVYFLDNKGRKIYLKIELTLEGDNT